MPLVWASSVWSAAKPSRRERLVRGARERLLAWRDAFGRMQCGLSAASPRVALIGSRVGGGEGVQEGKIHAHGAPPDNLTRDALPTLCATAARRGYGGYGQVAVRGRVVRGATEPLNVLTMSTRTWCTRVVPIDDRWKPCRQAEKHQHLPYPPSGSCRAREAGALPLKLSGGAP